MLKSYLQGMFYLFLILLAGKYVQVLLALHLIILVNPCLVKESF